MKNILKNKLVKVVGGILFVLVVLFGISTTSIAQSTDKGVFKVAQDTTLLEVIAELKQLVELSVELGVEPEPEVSFGAFGSPDVYTEVFLHNGLTLGHLPFATTTPKDDASATLNAGDIFNIGYHVVTLGGAQSVDFTYTFPASTTMAHGLNTIGDSKEVCFFNTATSTSASSIIFVAGVGIDLEYATTTGADVGGPALAIAEENTGCFNFIRQATANFAPGNFTVQVFLGENAD